MSWRDRFADVADDGTPAFTAIRVDVTPLAASFLSRHAKRQDMNRSDWIRLAISEQLLREGADEVPDLKPYAGRRISLEVPHA